MSFVKPLKPNYPYDTAFTPLGIIAIFIALSETIAGLAAIKTNGIVQIIFASFSVFFPLLIAFIFFLILWKKSYVLYPPRDFGPNVDVGRYVEAMRHQAIGNQELQALLRTTIDETFKSQEARTVLSQASANSVNGSGLSAASHKIAEQAFDMLQSAVITVDISSYKVSPNSELVFPYDPNDQAFSLLSAIYFQIEDFVAPYAYGKQWVLLDTNTNEYLLPKNIDWNDNESLANSRATVEEFGLRAGSKLRALPMAQPFSRSNVKNRN